MFMPSIFGLFIKIRAQEIQFRRNSRENKLHGNREILEKKERENIYYHTLGAILHTHEDGPLSSRRI